MSLDELIKKLKELSKDGFGECGVWCPDIEKQGYESNVSTVKVEKIRGGSVRVWIE